MASIKDVCVSLVLPIFIVEIKDTGILPRGKNRLEEGRRIKSVLVGMVFVHTLATANAIHRLVPGDGRFYA
jgi:hypothetical protein